MRDFARLLGVAQVQHSQPVHVVGDVGEATHDLDVVDGDAWPRCERRDLRRRPRLRDIDEREPLVVALVTVSEV